MEEMTYEEASRKLEEIIEKLESGTLSMSEAVKLFEEGFAKETQRKETYKLPVSMFDMPSGNWSSCQRLKICVSP